MTPEEYQRLKEAEKEHLRKLRALKEAARRLQRQQSINRALHGLTAGRRQVLDEHERTLEELALDTARHEARLDLALDAAPPAGDPDEELQKARARDLIRQMKQAVAAEAETPSKPDATPKDEAPEDETPENPPLPEKTIGRMKP